MKKNILKTLAFALVMIAAPVLSACGGDKTTDAPVKTETKADKKADLPNYRYVDMDSISLNYNLAKDYTEEMIRMQSNMENEAKRHESSIQSFATSMQNKMQNNGYLSKESYDADQTKLNNMQATAQRAMATLQSNFENSALNSQKTVNDSIQAFIKDYNAKKGYDAIFIKATTLYIDPALDITNEVIEGLNKRYNKVKK